MLTVAESAEMFTEGSPGTGLPEEGRNFHKGEKVACPSIGIGEVEERVGKGFQLGQNCSGNVPRTDEHESCQWDSPASG